MELTCSLLETRRVAALAGAETINLYLRERIWLELPITPKRSASGVLDEVRSNVEAAVAGRFEEKLCVWKGKVVASRYVLHSSGDRSQWPLRLRPIFMPGRRRITRYQPYG